MISSELKVSSSCPSLLNQGREPRGPEEVAGQRKCQMDLGVEITDSKMYVLWLAKRKGESIAFTIDTHQHSKAGDKNVKSVFFPHCQMEGLLL